MCGQKMVRVAENKVTVTYTVSSLVMFTNVASSMTDNSFHSKWLQDKEKNKNDNLNPVT